MKFKERKENVLFDLKYYPIRLKNRSKEKFGLWFANHLPRYLVTWCGIRIASNLDDCNMPLMDAIGCWDK